mmetsp:Transcript_14708/g.34414  ORF Transcript_14708/g.34414 Transcript_14708/m.34414 type:complete len:187 (+) Transcript_14708:69-629(+)
MSALLDRFLALKRGLKPQPSSEEDHDELPAEDNATTSFDERLSAAFRDIVAEHTDPYDVQAHYLEPLDTRQPKTPPARGQGGKSSLTRSALPLGGRTLQPRPKQALHAKSVSTQSLLERPADPTAKARRHDVELLDLTAMAMPTPKELGVPRTAKLGGAAAKAATMAKSGGPTPRPTRRLGGRLPE